VSIRVHPWFNYFLQAGCDLRRVEEGAVEFAALLEFLMAALVHQPSVFEQENPVGVLHGGETLRNDERRSSLTEPLHRFLNEPLCLRVHAGRGVVKDQDARIQQEGAGDGDALALPPLNDTPRSPMTVS
jgi:hypothetical protein